MSRTVVDDPEEPASIIIVRWPSHHLPDEAVKGLDAVLGLAAAKDPGIVGVQTGDVGPGAIPKVLVLSLHRATRAASTRRVFASAGLNAGCLVRRDHELVIPQRLAIPGAGMHIKNATGFDGKVGIAREGPATVVPGPNGILMQPTQRAAADECHQA
ncbi:hypothetical protein SBA3_910039 [Candidatus Sulfopaludibacter sp. SbA3]|nr:hypothetical protein SBA3_910039 [Candidatus Sulfopaludibacter sp. SbA3]